MFNNYISQLIIIEKITWIAWCAGDTLCHKGRGNAHTLRWRKNRKFRKFRKLGQVEKGEKGPCGARDRCKVSIGHKFAGISQRDRGRKLWLAGKRDGRCPKRKRSATGRASTNRWWSCVSRAATDWNGRGSIESIRPAIDCRADAALPRSSRKLSTIAPLSTAVRDSFLSLSFRSFFHPLCLFFLSSLLLCCLLAFNICSPSRRRVYFGENKN